MLRLALACGMVLLLSGCASPAPAPVQAAPVPDDGVLVTATRVEPLAHPVDVAGTIRSHPCSGEDDCGFTLYGAGGPGLAWDEPQVDAGDPLALFWRVWLVADSPSDPLMTPSRQLLLGDGFELAVYATTPCGIGCMREREVGRLTGAAGVPAVFDGLEVYLREGETGIRARFTPLAMQETYVGEAGYPYSIQGTLAGYRAVAEPVVIG